MSRMKWGDLYMCFLPLKFFHYPSQPVPIPELFGKYPTRPVPKSKTPTRRALIADRRSWICENHWKTIKACEKTFNGIGAAKPLKKHRTRWCPMKKYYHCIVSKIWPLCQSILVPLDDWLLHLELVGWMVILGYQFSQSTFIANNLLVLQKRKSWMALILYLRNCMFVHMVVALCTEFKCCGTFGHWTGTFCDRLIWFQIREARWKSI